MPKEINRQRDEYERLEESQTQSERREYRPSWPPRRSSPQFSSPDKIISYLQQLRYERELQGLTPEQQEAKGMEERVEGKVEEGLTEQQEAEEKVEGGVIEFFKGLVRGVGEVIKVTAISIASGILTAALLPSFGPLAVGISLGVGAAVTQIQENLKSLDLGLRDDTIRKLAEPLQGKVLDDSTLRKTIEDVLSEDRQANEDLAKAFTKLLPTINRAAAATNIEFSGPVQGLTIGDHNTVYETFNGFLQDGL